MKDRAKVLLGLAAAAFTISACLPPEPRVKVEVDPNAKTGPNHALVTETPPAIHILETSGQGKNSENNNTGLKVTDPTIVTGNAEPLNQVNPTFVKVNLRR